MNSTDVSFSFWHRRTLLVLLVISLILVCFTLAQTFLPRVSFFQSIDIPLAVMLLSSLTIIISFTGILVKNEKAIWLFSFLSYVSLLLATGSGVLLAGDLDSKFVSLWMMLAIFSGLWSTAGIATTFIVSVGIGSYMFGVQQSDPSQIVLFVIAFMVPVLVSYIGLRRRRTSVNGQVEAYHALAQELSTVANKSEIVINAIGDGVVATDNKGVIQLINPAAQNIIGWGKQEAVDLDYRSVFKVITAKGEPVEDSVDPIQRVLKGGKSITTNELLLETNSGKKMNISLLVSPIGKFGNGAIVVFRDITSEISENQQRAEFVSTASHEMRTPVAAIEGYLGLALNPQTAQIDDKARSYLMKAHESAQHLGRLFQDLLDVSRAEDGRLKTDPAVIDLVSFTRESVAMLAPKAAEHGLSLLFQPDANDSESTLNPILYAEVDPDHVREVLTNLIDNAIKYTKEGSVTVDVTGNDDNVLISVTDSGIGIAREDIPHLFQKFYRIDNTDTREIGGTGLGLYLCRRLVESMNGRIWVESTQGKGSTFFVEVARLSHEQAEGRKNQQIIIPDTPNPHGSV